MTRTATTKLVATALAVASLGLASTAQAAEEQGIVAGEQDVEIQKNIPTPGNPGLDEPVEDPGVKVAPEPEEPDYDSPEYYKSDEAKQRFERYCNMKDAEPSHSDKKFCEDFRKHNMGSASSTGNGHQRPKYCDYINVRYDPECDKWAHETTKPDYEEHNPKPHYEKPRYSKTEPVAVKRAEEPSKGSLPFTGLEIWQLGLIGIVLVGGGFGARRLLASRDQLTSPQRTRASRKGRPLRVPRSALPRIR